MSNLVLRATGRAWIGAQEDRNRHENGMGDPRDLSREFIHANRTKTQKSFGVQPIQAAVLTTNGGGELAARSGNNVRMSF